MAWNWSLTFLLCYFGSCKNLLGGHPDQYLPRKLMPGPSGSMHVGTMALSNSRVLGCVPCAQSLSVPSQEAGRELQDLLSHLEPPRVRLFWRRILEGPQVDIASRLYLQLTVCIHWHQSSLLTQRLLEGLEGSTFELSGWSTKTHAQSFEKSFIKKYALNHVGVLHVI